MGLTRALGARDSVGGPIGPAIAFVHVAIVLRDVRGGGFPRVCVAAVRPLAWGLCPALPFSERED